MDTVEKWKLSPLTNILKLNGTQDGNSTNKGWKETGVFTSLSIQNKGLH